MSCLLSSTATAPGTGIGRSNNEYYQVTVYLTGWQIVILQNKSSTLKVYGPCHGVPFYPYYVLASKYVGHIIRMTNIDGIRFAADATRALVILMVAAVLSACGGSDGAGFAPTPPPAPEPPPFGANYSEIQANVFTPTCAASGCHIGVGAPHGLALDPANSYALLVGVQSAQSPGTLRVSAGNPDASYLIDKLEGTASFGNQMPFGGPPLSQAEIDVIALWILQGAVDDRNPSPAPIRVTSMSPLPGSTIIISPREIIAMFDRELDVSTVNDFTFLLDGSGGDGTFDDGNEIPVTAFAITTPASDPRSATFDLSGMVLAPDTYRVRLLGDGASFIMDLGTNRLDGEWFGVFPSGNGTEGGDFETTFEVGVP